MKKWGWVAAIVMIAVCMSVLSACRRPVVSVVDDARIAALDSTLSDIADPDSLATLAAWYHSQGDISGELMAIRYQGKALRKQSLFDQAVKVHTHGYQLAVSARDTIEMIAALDNIATVYRRKGELSTANGYYYKALKICDAYSGKDHPRAVKQHVVTLNGIGNIELDLCHYATADSVLREALSGEQMLGSNLGQAINYANLGAIKRAKGETDSAWVYYRKSMEYNKLAGDEGGIAVTHLCFGDLYENEHNYSHAINEYKQAYDMLKQQGDSWHWLESCLALASVNILMGEVDDARRYLQEADVEALNINSKHHQARASRIHYELSLLDGDTKTALTHYIHSEELYDSIHGLEKNEEIRRQRQDYQSSRISGEVDLLNKDITHLKRVRNMQLALTFLLLIMAGIIIAALVYAMRARARTQSMLRQVEETRSLFFTNVVHQLRTPLSAIMGATDLILVDKNNVSETQRDNLQVIERQGKNLLELVDRILEVGGVRSAISKLEWQTGDTVALLRMVVESYHDRCLERHIELTYAPRESSCEMNTVPHYLTTIMGSLIENAINYSKDFSRITITSRVDDGKLTIKVADDGIGISKNDLPHVFEPFYRGAAAEQMIDGVGIGLTVVRDMAMAMGGKVAVDSMLDHGSVFTVILPCRHEQGIKGRFENFIAPVINLVRNRKEVQLMGGLDDNDDTGKPLVLVIEDHVDVARLVGLALGDNYAVSYAVDGEQGLNKAHAIKPDLIITDVKMPVMDGLELCHRVRRSATLRHIPIIMISARTSDADRVRGIEAGADAYLVKPFVREELRAWANRLVESRRQIIHLLNEQSRQEPQEVYRPEVNDDGQRFIIELNEELNSLIDKGEKIDLDKVALRFRMGESQLRKKLQQLTGKNASAYVMQLRMEKAMRLLCDRTDLLIGDVAMQCGFQDVAYFSRVFRQQYGMTPTQARNQR